MNKKIWNTKNIKSSKEIDLFLSSDDIELDKYIFVHDIDGTIAHVKSLKSMDILKASEESKILKKLKELKLNYINGSFKLSNKYEDCHSAIEIFLIKELGDIGKKIHTGRSRNDQVLVATRLFAKEQLINIKNQNKLIASQFLTLAFKHEKIPMPGYTHIQRAMPSSWGLWFASFAESFIDNIDLIIKTIDWIDSNPLGTAAGYGVALPLDRKKTTKDLGFNRIQINSLYAQNSRGKYEMQIINTLKQPMLDLRKFAWDMSLFLSQEFNLLSIDNKYSTGSSIMPNKSNPDVIEIIRANYSILAGLSSELENLLSLPSGYHRDLQLTKRSLVSSFIICFQTLSIIPDILKSIKVNKTNSSKYINEDMMMTDKVYENVAAGMSFRDAYDLVKNNPVDKKINTVKSKNYSLGSPKNLELNILKKRLTKIR